MKISRTPDKTEKISITPDKTKVAKDLMETLSSSNKEKVEELVKEYDSIKKITGDYSSQVVDILLKMLEKVERWKVRGLGRKIIENDRVHVIEMIYITQKYFEIYPGLNNILDLEEIIIKIAIHDLGEVGVGDLSHNAQLSLSKEELEKHKEKEQKFALKLIGTLNRVDFLKEKKEKIEKLKKYYIEYEENKRNPDNLNDYFVKFIDIYQAFIHMINHLHNLKKLPGERPIFEDFKKLKKFNEPFKEKGFDLLYLFEKIIDNKNISKKDIEKILHKN